mmetsp:Transcript_20575/g.31456  ORF Transcript_20575/g.31456 Transcript_20575/m.31456 type:complete len:208 (+) Transcript_20575:953-1576(+)
MTTDAQCIISQSMQQLIQQLMPLQILQDPIRTRYHTTVRKLSGEGLLIALPPPRKVLQCHRIHQDVSDTILKAERAPDGQDHRPPLVINGDGVGCVCEAALKLRIDQFGLVQSGMFQEGGLMHAADVVGCYGAKNSWWLLLLLCFFVLFRSSSSSSMIIIGVTSSIIVKILMLMMILHIICTTTRSRRAAEDTTTTTPTINGIRRRG